MGPRQTLHLRKTSLSQEGEKTFPEKKRKEKRKTKKIFGISCPEGQAVATWRVPRRVRKKKNPLIGHMHVPSAPENRIEGFRRCANGNR